MLSIWKADCYRMFKGKAIYIVFFIIIILCFISAIGLSSWHIGLSSSSNIDISDPEFIAQLSQASSLKEVRDLMKSEGAFPLDQSVIAQNINLYYIFIVIVVIVLCTDFSNHTIKNTLSSAISKKTYYIAKTSFIFFLCTILTLFQNYFFYIINILINGTEFSSPFFEFTKNTFLQLPVMYGMISMLICFAFFVQKTSIFNTISIPFIILIQIVVLGFTGLFHISADWFYQYEFQFVLSNLVDQPSTIYIIKCMLLSLFYCILFHTIGYWVFKREEIK